MWNKKEIKADDDNTLSYHDLIDPAELQKLQDEFCRVTGVYAWCLDEKRELVTSVYGNKEESEALMELLEGESLEYLLERVEPGGLEEVAIEELAEQGLHAAAVSVRIEGRPVIYWIMVGVTGTQRKEEKELTEDRAAEAGPFCSRLSPEAFYRALDLLRHTSAVLFQNKVSCFSAQAKRRRSLLAEEEMRKSLRTIEAVASIVQLLERDDSIEGIMEKFLEIMGSHLELDDCQLLQADANQATMDVIGEWCREGRVSVFERTRQLEIYSYLGEEEPLVYSSEGESAGPGEIFEGQGLKALMVFPILMEETGGIYLCLNQREEKRSWEMQEVKFVADAAKILQAIIARRVQRNSLAGSLEALSTILDHAGCAIGVYEKASDRLLFANQSIRTIFGRDFLEGKLCGILRKGVETERSSNSAEIYVDSMGKWFDCFYMEITWVNNSRAEMFSLYDITDKKRYQQNIEQQAYTDFLTGLYNRLCCEKDLAWHVDESKNQGETGALLYLDLDDFKHINDGLGHKYGDRLLQSVSRALREVEGIGDTCYRVGGDEFIIILPPDRVHMLDHVIEGVKDMFNRPWLLKDAEYYCTMSMGIVFFPDSGDSVNDLIKKADIAMYEAKKSGKNRVAKYSDSIDTYSGRRLDIERSMRDASLEGCSEFQVYFQPILEVQNGETVCKGAEALARWKNDRLGMISPAEFIPLAEYLGLIIPIGGHILMEACRHCKYWNDNGYPDYKVNVNLSVVQLTQPDVVSTVERALRETGVNPKNLTLEVTESLAIHDMERMKEILGRIKDLGVRIALDDFGTGYSSLNHIREIPLDVIKVDRSFIRDLADSAYSKAFIKMVAELAETIGVAVCAEGVETREQYQVLNGMKVQYIQGYYFDKPLPGMDFEKKYTPGLAKAVKSM